MYSIISQLLYTVASPITLHVRYMCIVNKFSGELTDLLCQDTFSYRGIKSNAKNLVGSFWSKSRKRRWKCFSPNRNYRNYRKVDRYSLRFCEGWSKIVTLAIFAPVAMPSFDSTVLTAHFQVLPAGLFSNLFRAVASVRQGGQMPP